MSAKILAAAGLLAALVGLLAPIFGAEAMLFIGSLIMTSANVAVLARREKQG